MATKTKTRRKTGQQKLSAYTGRKRMTARQRAEGAKLRKYYPQSGRSAKKSDERRIAQHPGWRRSKRTGKLYFEARKNRSDTRAERVKLMSEKTYRARRKTATRKRRTRK